MIGIVLVRNSAKLTIYRTGDSETPSIRSLFKSLCSSLSICSSFRAKVPPGRNIKIKWLIYFLEYIIGLEEVGSFNDLFPREPWKEIIDEIHRITSIGRKGRTNKDPMIKSLFSLTATGENSRTIIGNSTRSYSYNGVIWKTTT